MNPNLTTRGRLELWARGLRLRRLCPLSGFGLARRTARPGAADRRRPDGGWAFLDLAFAMTQAPTLFALGAIVDVLRDGRLVRISAVADRAPAEAEAPPEPAAPGVARARSRGAGGAGRRLRRSSVALRLTAFGDPARLALFDRPRADGFRPRAGRTAVPQPAGGRALEHQAAVPGARRRRSFSTSISSPMRCCSTASTRTRGACAASFTRSSFRWWPCRRCATATGPSASRCRAASYFTRPR